MENELDGMAPTEGQKQDPDDGFVARVRRVYRQSRSADVPDHVIEPERAAFRAFRRDPTRTVYVARLYYDSWTNVVVTDDVREAVTLPVRDREDTSARHQIFSTAWHDVDLYGERQTNELWYLIGQILPKSAEVAVQPKEAILVGEGRAHRAVSHGGEFHIGSVRSGTYQLRLQLDRAEVLVPNVRVGV